MRYSPYVHETTALASMNEHQLLEYFLTRAFETEEIWGLDDGCEWVMQEIEAEWVMPIWPYRQLAESTAAAWPEAAPTAESLEDFVFQTLGALIQEGALLEVMSEPGRQGCLISAQRLYEIFTGMMSAGEYTLDG